VGDLGISFAQHGAAFVQWFSNPLTALVLWPLIGCLFISLTARTNLRQIRFFAVLFTSLPVFVCICMLTGLPAALMGNSLFSQYQPFSPTSGFNFTLPADQYTWFAVKFGEAQSFTINWNVGVDGISMPLLVLTASIMLLAALWGLRRTERLREYFALFLLLEAGLLGIFVALDYVLFYLFWELMLIPMYFLIAGWGKRKEESARAAIKFFIYTVSGSVFYLIGFIALQIFSNHLTFSIPEISEKALRGDLDFLPFSFRLLMFIGLMLAFAVKIPMFPFHTWLPDAHTEAPTEMSVVLAAVMLKTGAYGMIRIVYDALPDVAYQMGPIIAACGVIAIVYGAGVTLVQTDLKRMVAYSSISHMGFIVLGIASLNFDGLVGSVFHMVGHGVIIATLFFLSGVIEERYGTRDLRELSGMLRLAPAYGGVLAIAGFAAMGFPLMMGFWGEFLILKGAYFNNPNWQQVHVGAINGSTFLQWCAILSVIGILGSAVYMINMLTKVLTSDASLPVLVPAMATAGTGLALSTVGTQLAASDIRGLATTDAASSLPTDEAIDVVEVSVPPTDPGGRALKPWRGMQPLHAMVLIPLTAAMLLFFWWPGPIINSAQVPATGLYSVWLMK